MKIFHIRDVILSHYKSILFITLSTALILALTLPTVPRWYKTSSTVILNYKGTDALMGSSGPGQSTAGYLSTYIATQVDIIKSPTVAKRVLDSLTPAASVRLQTQYANKDKKIRFVDAFTPSFIAQDNLLSAGVTKDPLASTKPTNAITSVTSNALASDMPQPFRNALVQDLMRNLDVKPSRDSSVLEVSVKNRDPQLAALLANAYVAAYRSFAVELEANPSLNASDYFTNQLKPLREALDLAQHKVSQYQKDNGIVNVDTRADTETSRLAELTSQLVLAQAQRMEASARRSKSSGEAGASPDMENNLLIQSLRMDMNKADVKLGRISQKYGVNHYLYREAETELSKLRTALAQQQALTSSTIASNASIFEQRENALRSAVSAQKSQVLDLNKKRDELTLLTKDVESAQRIFENVSQRLAQSKIVAQAGQSDISVLTPAVIPETPIGLSFKTSFFIGTFLGLLFACLAAALFELLDRRVRSPEDLAIISGLPVLTTVKGLYPSPFPLSAKR